MWFLLLACSAPSAPPVTTPVSSSGNLAADESKPHSHEGKQGGAVQMIGNLHVEAVFAPSGLMVWLRDEKEQPLDPTPFTGTAVIQRASGTETVSLLPMGNQHLHAELPLELGKPASAVVTLTVDGKPSALIFRTEAVGMAAHDHSSLHGGVVSMWGDAHVEYVAKDGEYRFYLSDAHRVPLTSGVSGSVKDGDKEIPLVFDASTGLLHGPGEGAGSRPVMLEATLDGKAFSLGFNAAGS